MEAIRNLGCLAIFPGKSSRLLITLFPKQDVVRRGPLAEMAHQSGAWNYN